MRGFLWTWPEVLSLKSIRGRLALLLALAFLPSGVIALQSGLTALSTREAAVQGQRGVVSLRSLSLARDEITQMRESVRSLAANAGLFVNDRAQCQRVLASVAKELGQIIVMGVLDEDAVVRCANLPEAAGRRTAALPLIVEARISGDVAVGYVPNPRMANEPVIGAVAAMDRRYAPGNLYVSVTRAVSPMVRDVRRGAATTVALVDRGGRILAFAGPPLAGNDGAALERQFRENAAPALTATFRVGDHWAIGLPIQQDADIYLVEIWSPDPTDFSSLLQAAWVLLLPLLLWLLAVGATWFAVEYFVARPLLLVETLARSYARGDADESDAGGLEGAPVEILSLRRTLAAMAKTLRGREARLATALQEERALLLELNHRVKNNLQLVASMLSIQARDATEPVERRALARAQERVQLLAMAHVRIYDSGEVRDVALDQLIGDVARTLVSGRCADVTCDLDLEPMRAGADIAVPLAFLVGESVSLLLDMVEGGAPVQRLKVRLAGRTPGQGFIIDIAADAPPGTVCPPSLARQKLIAAFAHQIGARLDETPFHIRIDRTRAARLESTPSA